MPQIFHQIFCLPRRVFPSALAGLLVATFAVGFSGSAAAQTSPQSPPAATKKAAAPIPDALREPLQDMRDFISDIAAYGRKIKPSFVVVVDGLPLVADVDELDHKKLNPNVAFMENIDGVLVDGLRHPHDGPREEDAQARIEELAKIAQNNRLAILTIEHTDPENAGAAIARDQADQYIPFVPTTALMDTIPRVPTRPVSENGNSIADLASVKNHLVIRDSSQFGTPTQYLNKVRNTNYDLLVTDIYHGRQTLGRKTIENLKFKLLGAKRMVLATIDIAHTSPFHFYWKPEWTQGSPRFIDEPVRGDKTRHYTRYWYSGWRDIIMGNRQSYVFGLISQGFDGIVIRGTGAYRLFDGSLEEEMEMETKTEVKPPQEQPAPKPSAAK